MGIRTAPIGIFLLALILRLGYLLEIRGTPLTELLLIDSATYDRLARLLLSGEFRGEEVYAMNVLYPFFLGLVYALKGGLLSVLGLQAVLDAASCVLVLMLGDRFFDRRVGMVAGLGLALYAPAVFYTGALLTPTLLLFLGMLLLWLLARFAEQRSAGLVVGAGLVLGLLVLGRGNHLLFLPLAWFWFRRLPPGEAPGRFRNTLRSWGLFAMGALLLVALVTVRNYRVEGKLVPIAANYAALYIGHNPGATGLYAMPFFTESASFESEVWGTRDAISEILGRPVTLAESSRYLFGEALGYAATHPGHEIELLGHKLYFLFNRTESPTNLNFYFAEDFSRILRWLPLRFGLLAAFGLFGVWLARRDWRRHLLLYLFAAVPVLTGLLFFVSAEYRLSLAPVLMLFGAHAGIRLFDTARRRAFLPIWVRAAVLLPVLLVATHLRTPLLRAQSLKRVDYLNFGTLYRNQGEPEKARQMFERSLAIDPRYAPAYLGLAAVYEQAGNEMEAARLAELARRFRPPGDPSGPSGPGSLLAEKLLAAGRIYQSGDYPAAQTAFEEVRVLANATGDTAALLGATNNIGLCLYKMRDLAGAERIFQELIADHPDYVKAYNNLGKVREAQGRVLEAMEFYRRTLARDPGNAVARRQLTRLDESGSPP